jgi:hypothetical protein
MEFLGSPSCSDEPKPAPFLSHANPVPTLILSSHQNVGLTSALFHSVFPTGTVYAFFPVFLFFGLRSGRDSNSGCRVENACSRCLATLEQNSLSIISESLIQRFWEVGTRGFGIHKTVFRTRHRAQSYAMWHATLTTDSAQIKNTCVGTLWSR